jgi:dCMP deaminase
MRSDFTDHLKKNVIETAHQRSDRQSLKLQVFANVCKELSRLSYDPKHKVATIIFTNDFRDICAIGYNGNYKGGPNERDSGSVGMSGFLHSEENALLHLGIPYESRERLSLMCTHKPCRMCMKRIANSGIKNVYYLEEYDSAGSIEDIVKVSGINLLKL